MYYTYHRISKELYDYCITNKIVDASLIAKWKKPGYERLCSTYVINPRNYKFGTVSICRVPKHCLAPGTEIEDPMTGCRGCASGASSNIFGTKYGQYLAAIQVAREERLARKRALQQQQEEEAAEEASDNEDSDNEDGGNDNDSDAHKQGDASDEEDLGPVTTADGRSEPKKVAIWATSEQEQNIELADEMIGELAADAKREAMQAMAKSSLKASAQESGPPGKRSRQN